MSQPAHATYSFNLDAATEAAQREFEETPHISDVALDDFGRVYFRVDGTWTPPEEIDDELLLKYLQTDPTFRQDPEESDGMRWTTFGGLSFWLGWSE